jgi:sulfoxide reductase heme-binding subunit YedZ
MLAILNIGLKRWVTHIVLALLSVLGCVVTAQLKPEWSVNFVVTVGLGYLSLALMVFVLLIGPWQLFRNGERRRNPVNIDLRRDAGIWAGLTGVTHVVFGFTLHLGGDILRYLSPSGGAGFRDWFFFFGFSNWTGLIGTVILIVLLLISNDFSLSKLKGPRWKLIQQSNYILMALVVLHTFGYQITINRERIMTVSVIVLVLVVMLLQVIGFSLYRRRRLNQPVDNPA